MRVDRHLVLVLTKELDGVSCSRVVLEARHHELLGKAVRSDLLGERRVEGPQPAKLRLLSKKLICFLNLLPDNLLDVLHMRNLRVSLQPRAFGVLTVTRG